jgi:hypothetical protein
MLADENTMPRLERAPPIALGSAACAIRFPDNSKAPDYKTLS